MSLKWLYDYRAATGCDGAGSDGPENHRRSGFKKNKSGRKPPINNLYIFNLQLNRETMYKEL
jgi:hypothetical protein